MLLRQMKIQHFLSEKIPAHIFGSFYSDDIRAEPFRVMVQVE